MCINLHLDQHTAFVAALAPSPSLPKSARARRIRRRKMSAPSPSRSAAILPLHVGIFVAPACPQSLSAAGRRASSQLFALTINPRVDAQITRPVQHAFLIGSAAIKNRCNTMKTNGGVRF
jgi:hypothetical protein